MIFTNIKKLRDFLTLLFFPIVSIVFFTILWSRRNLYWTSWKLPGPFSLPIFGSIQLAFGLKTTEDMFKKVLVTVKKYGPTFRFWMGPRLVIFVSTPQDLEVIFNNPECFDKDLMVMKGMRAALGDGLITAPVAVWQPHRKLINPTFSPKILSSFLDNFVDNANGLAEKIRKHEGKEEFNILPYVFKTNVRFICETALGINFNTSKDVEEVLTKYLDESMEICFERMGKPWLYPDIVFFNSEIGRKFKRNLNYVNTITNKFIQEKRQELKRKKLLKENNKCEEENEFDYVFKKKNFIELLIEQNENGKGFTDIELRDQIVTFITGGSDTAASTVSYACMLLGRYPDCQDEAYTEIKQIFGDSDRRITVEDISKMKYLERVIKETMRFFPAVPLLVRYLSNDVKFSTMTAPAGSTILFSHFFTHTDPKYWQDPLKFDPDRFLPDEILKRHPYSYVPFGGGPRHCIGSRFAMMSMKIVLCTLLRQYRFKSNIDIGTIRLKVEITLKAVEGHPVQIELREQ